MGTPEEQGRFAAYAWLDRERELFCRQKAEEYRNIAVDYDEMARDDRKRAERYARVARGELDALDAFR